jgi:hypothetical protein
MHNQRKREKEEEKKRRREKARNELEPFFVPWECRDLNTVWEKTLASTL